MLGSCSAPCHLSGDSERMSSWLQSESALDIVTSGGVNKLMEHLSLAFPCLSVTQTFKQILLKNYKNIVTIILPDLISESPNT